VNATRSHRGGSGLALFAALLLSIGILMRGVIDQPPVWDTTTGLFPAAIVLAENGFDLADLLSRPGWAQGGPNIHQFSSVTWGTALVLWLVPEREVWLPLLHAIHFALAAGPLLGAFRLGASLLPPPLALASVCALLLFPLFQTQVGYLYTELPLAFCTVWAVHAASERRFGRAALWSALACSVKEAGLVVPVALAAGAALERGPLAEKLRRVAALAVPAAVFVGLQLAFALPVEQAFGVRPIPYGEQLRDVARKLGMLPDLCALLLGFAVSAALALPASWRALRLDGGDDPAARVRALSLLVVGAFAGFYLLVPTTGVEVYVLPRYYVQIAPFVLLGCVDLAYRLGGVRRTAGGVALLALFFLLNRSGELVYPPVPGNEFSLAERSAEYRDLLFVQRELLDAAKALPEDLPVFYGLPEHFLLQYPRLGYAEQPLRNGHCIWLDARRRRPRLADFPERFAILYDFIGYGGVQLQSLVRQARAHPERQVRVTPFERGRYRTLLFEISPGFRDSM
jgi:hypothetical protein